MERERHLPQGFYWLLPAAGGRGGLAGMPCPQESELSVLPEVGIGVVVSLLESTRGNYCLPPALRLVRIPVDDGRAPADAHLSLMEQACEFVHRFRLQPPPLNGVAAHCLHGRGRTGLFLAAYRVYVTGRYPEDPDGCPAEQARAEVDDRLHRVYGMPVSALEPEQARWLRRFERHCRRPGLLTAQLAAEATWSRKIEGHGSDADRCWRCPDCDGVAITTMKGATHPRWCPSCGWPTEP